MVCALKSARRLRGGGGIYKGRGRTGGVSVREAIPKGRRSISSR